MKEIFAEISDANPQRIFLNESPDKLFKKVFGEIPAVNIRKKLGGNPQMIV